MPRNKFGQPTREIKYDIYIKDLPNYLRYERLIRQSIEQKKDVSYRLLKGYLDVLYGPHNQEMPKARRKALNADIDKRRDIVLAFFKNKPHYQFQYRKSRSQRIMRLDMQVQHIYSLNDFITSLFTLLKEDFLHHVVKNKYLLMEYVFEELESYIKDSKGHSITRYSKGVIIGAICMAFDFLLTETEHNKRPAKSKKQAYTEYLSDSVKYLFKSKNRVG